MTIAVNNYFKDFKKLKNKITSLQNVSDFFIGYKYSQIDLSVNYLLSLVQDRSNNVFLNKQFILLVYIGGITFGELAAVRYLNKKNRNKKFIVLTTGMINYKNIFDALKEGEYFLKDNKGQETKN